MHPAPWNRFLWARNSPPFTDPKSSLPCSQKQATGPYDKTRWIQSTPLIIFLQINFNIIIPCKHRFPKLLLLTAVSDNNFVRTLFLISIERVAVFALTHSIFILSYNEGLGLPSSLFRGSYKQFGFGIYVSPLHLPFMPFVKQFCFHKFHGIECWLRMPSDRFLQTLFRFLYTTAS